MLTQALLIALAASVDAAYLRASESRRLAGHGGDHDDNGSLGGCTNDPDWCVSGVLGPVEAAGFPFDSLRAVFPAC